MPHDDVILEIRRSALSDPALYGDSFAEVYDAWYGDLNDTDFVAAVAARMPAVPQKILELGVGTGRLARLLHAARHPIADVMTGIDSSELMLEKARRVGVDRFMNLVRGDFSLKLPEEVHDFVFVGYNTLFNLPTTDAIARCLTLVSYKLRGGGVFMVDAVIPNEVSTEEHVETRTMANGDVVRSVSVHDPGSRTITGYFSHLVDGQTAAMRPWNVHYLHPDDLDDMARSVGLSLENRWADGIGTTFTAESSRHISTYVKR